MQKLYCYVDETGQDSGAEFFIVVAVVSMDDQDNLRSNLLTAEQRARTHHLKWHKSKPERRLKYLEIVLEKRIAKGDVYFSSYKKPLPYFLPMLDAIEKAVRAKNLRGKYGLTVIIDGIDRKKAAELTNALRIHNLRLRMVRGRRDENEPVLRLADMWAGCIRYATRGDKPSEDIYKLAIASKYLVKLGAE